MKSKIYLLPLFILFFIVRPAFSQFAPDTFIPDTVACPGGTFTVPVKVTNFNKIGVINLTLQFDMQVLSLQSWTNTSGFPGLNVNSGVPGKIVIGGFSSGTSGVTYPDHTSLLTLTFNYAGGISSLYWFDNGPNCEYTGPAPFYQALIDVPYADYYHNGSVQASLVPLFSASDLTPEVGDTVVFSDISSGSPTSWSWSFQPATIAYLNGTTSTSQHPDVVFNANGPYEVTLQVSDGVCTRSLTTANYIHAGTDGLWTGTLSSDWNTAANWHNGMVPVTQTAVVVPPSAPFWPEFAGDFTIGIQCASVTLNGVTSQLTINGDLYIP